MMHRRSLMHAGLAASAYALCAPLSSAWAGSLDVPLAQLQRMVQGQFPIHRTVVHGAQVQLSQPQVTLDALSQRIVVNADALLRHPLLALQERGQIGLDFGLRYATEDHSLRLVEPHLQELAFSAISQRWQPLVLQIGRDITRELLHDYPVYTLTKPQQMMLSALSGQTPEITVGPQGLKVAY